MPLSAATVLPFARAFPYFAAKLLKMDRTALFIILLSATASCGLRELGETVPEPRLPDYIDNFRTSTVVTGVAYPDGCGWNFSEAPSSGVPELVAYRDGERFLSIPVRAENFVAADIDMHRYADGHLYTDYSTETETIVSRDGTELFRYAGRERIVFLGVHDGHVLTLGESRSGQGFSSRSDGEPLFLGLEGTVFQNAGLSPDGELRFFYRILVNSTSGLISQYYAVTGTENVKIELPADVKTVYGFAFRDSPGGGVTALCRRSGGDGGSRTGLLDCAGGSFRKLRTPLFSIISGGSVLETSSPVLSVFSSSLIDGPYASTLICSGTKKYAQLAQGSTPVGFRHVADSVVGIKKALRTGLRDVLCNGSVRSTLPAGYTVMDGDALCCGNGGIKVGMTSRTGGRAILWDDGEVDSLDFRGIVTGVFEERVEISDGHAD